LEATVNCPLSFGGPSGPFFISWKGGGEVADKELLRVPEAARLLGLPAKTVRRMVREGVLPAIPAPKRPLISRRRLLAWLEGK
jgi:excisionase family DNA binding protein